MNREEILKEQWEKVPRDIKTAVLSPDLEKNLETILTSNNLPLYKMKSLENETILLMIGMSGTDDYIEEVGKIFSLSEDMVEKILTDVDRLILAPIKDSLIEFTDKENSAELVEKDQNLNVDKGKEIILESQNPFLPILSKTIDNGQKVPDSKQAMTIREEPKIPNVTSAMAAEIGSLIGEKRQDAKRVTYNAGQGAQTETQIKPEDKLSSVVESPRKEVEMVRRVTSENKVTDPYRESLG